MAGLNLLNRADVEIHQFRRLFLSNLPTHAFLTNVDAKRFALRGLY